MLTLTTSIDIAATPERVWEVLIDFPRHAEWNPMLTSIRGLPKVGEKLVISIAPPDTRAMTISPKLLVVDKPRELRWLGRLPIPGLFSGEHYFVVEPTGAGTVRFVHGENFRGLLVPFMKRMLTDNTRRGFEMMNQALKARVEGRG